MPNIKLNLLHARNYQSNGETRTSWTVVGVGWMNDKGIDIKMHAIPVGADADGCIRLFLREETEEERMRNQERRQQRPPQERRPQPQHRDQLQRPQQGSFGGAARTPDAGPQPPAYSDPDEPIPF